MSEAEPRSAALMAEVARGDPDALATLVGLWQRPLLGFVFRYVQNEADARDLVQETFVRIYEKRGAFRQGTAFSGWLFTIAANLCRNHVRWRTRHPSQDLTSASAAEYACARPAPDGALVASERVAAVRAAIAELPHDLKVTLLLHEYEGLSYAEIAEVVGCSVKGVEARLARARLRLREALGKFLGEGNVSDVAGGVTRAGLLAASAPIARKLAPTMPD